MQNTHTLKNKYILKNSNFTLHFSSVVLGTFQVLVHTVNLTRFKNYLGDKPLGRPVRGNLD